MRAIVIDAVGDADVLRYVEKPTPEPKPNEALIKTHAIGINFIDVYHRRGWYPMPLPFTPGLEGAGVVETFGNAVKDLRVGDRVAWSGVIGSYADYVAAPADKLVKIPDGISHEQAAAAMLQGMTAHYLSHSTYPLKQGDTALVHAAAGGVGLLLIQLAKRRGAKVIGLVSTNEKAALAKAAGADDVVLYTEEDFEAETKRLTGGRGVEVVYDSVGKDTYLKSLNALALRGMLVLYGQASGAVPPIDPQLLSQKGSAFLTRPTLAHYVAAREELLMRATDIFRWIETGALRLRLERAFALKDARLAHEALENRRTTGKVLLVP